MTITDGATVARLTRLLAATQTVKIATAGGAISPWLAAAFFAERGLYELHVMIEAQGKTLANIQANPRVAIMVDGGSAFTAFGQAEGRAVLEPGAADEYRAEIVAKTPESEPLEGLPNLRPVKISIDRWLVTDVSAGWLPAHELRPPLPARRSA